MKLYRKARSLTAAIITFGLLVGGASAAIMVDFDGGGGTPLSITLPSVTWQINDSDGFNGNPVFGIGIAVGQIPSNTDAGHSQAGNAGNFSSSNSTITFLPADGLASFSTNNNYAGSNAGGIIWFGIQSSRNANNGDTITFDGGTLTNDANTGAIFSDGIYDVYLISGATGISVTNAGTAVPEPSALIFIGCAGLSVMLKRTRHCLSNKRMETDR